MQRRVLNWLPAVVAPVLVAGVVAVPLVAAAAPSDVPPKTAQQVLELVSKAKQIAGFSGEVDETADLGLPELPTGTGGGSSGTDSAAASAIDLLTGTNRFDVAVAGDRSRVAVLDASAERDVVVNGDSTWFWDSKKQTAAHVVTTGERRTAQAPSETPAQVAADLLAKIDPTTAVGVETSPQVAGRNAYTLVLRPDTTATTIGSVRIAVDAVTGLPLSVQVVARGATTPAFQTAFTSIDYTVPAAATFDFTPPSGATVTTKHVIRTHVERPQGAKGAGDAARPAVSGSGWASVVTVPPADVPPDLASNPTVQRLSTAVDGGRLLSTPLVNVLLTADGRVLAGAVPASTLEAAAG